MSSMQIRVVDADRVIRGAAGVFGADTEINMRRVKDGVSLAQIRAATDGNNLDEILFRTDKGEVYVLYADELVGDVEFGDTVEFGGVRGQVFAINDERNEERVAAGAAAGFAIAGLGIAVAGFVLGAGAVGGAILQTNALAAGVVVGGGGTGATGVASGIAKLAGAFEETDAALVGISLPHAPKSVQR